MRAFMSRVHPPSSALHAEWLDHPDFGRFADQAEREARRILAEVEPDNPRPGCDDPSCYCYGTRREHSNIGPLAMCSPAYQALADTLRAFVGEGE